MGIGTSLVVFAVGAVMRFAVSVHTNGFNVHTIGVILMVVGVVGLLVSAIFWNSWGGFGTSRRSRIVRQDGATTVVDERSQY